MESKKNHSHPHSKKIINELCNYLGHDLDSPMCKELQLHLKDCPECLEYVRSVKLTVTILKETHKDEKTPPEVHQKLLEILNSKK